MIRQYFLAALAAASLALAAPPQTPPAKPTDARAFVPAAAVLTHLEQTIAWYKEVNALGVTADSASATLQRDNAHQLAVRGLQLGFDFARADAALRAAARQQADTDSGDTSQNHNIEEIAARAVQRVTSAEKRLADLDASMSKAPARNRAALTAQRQELEAELNLAKEIQKTVGSMVSFVGVAGSGGGIGGGLLGQINDLAKSVPESQRLPPTSSGTAAPPRQPAPAAPVAAANPEGMVGLAGEILSAGSARSELDRLVRSTEALVKSIDQLKLPLLTGLRASIAHSDALADQASSDAVAQLTSGQQEITQLTARFKQLSTVLVPLGEEQIVVEGVRGILLQQQIELKREDQQATHALLVRVGGLAVAIFFILAVSEVWRRATLRYVSDPRRRRQLLVIRRIVVGIAIAIIVVLGFVTEFGSLATYAGFLTAGLALALQNVILSVVAYFFLIGRYGVRTGDRVTIAGVTGEVIDIGLVRMYMMELGGSGPELHPTGRVVVYSNSVLFQPAAIFKQIPGTNYAWRTVVLTLAQETDFQLAEKTLTAAVVNVFEKYREAIEKQHQAMERSVEMQFQAPTPDCRLRFSDSGLEFVARYPVELARAREMDEQVMKALYEAIAQQPQLTLAPAGAPKLQAA